jgi:hypothetical protein
MTDNQIIDILLYCKFKHYYKFSLRHPQFEIILEMGVAELEIQWQGSEHQKDQDTLLYVVTFMS